MSMPMRPRRVRPVSPEFIAGALADLDSSMRQAEERTIEGAHTNVHMRRLLDEAHALGWIADLFQCQCCHGFGWSLTRAGRAAVRAHRARARAQP